ncbi:MAG: arginine--tRNA ligase, partial [Spirochaetaceae bacterium]
MTDIKNTWTQKVVNALYTLAAERSVECAVEDLMPAAETPPNRQLGDLAFPLFPFAKVFRSSPQAIAQDLLRLLDDDEHVSVAGPYLNIRFDRPMELKRILREVNTAAENWGRGSSMSGQRIMVEFSCPNTNKPLHLGHLRNDALGESVSRILQAAGADVRQVNLINNRGIHICQSMLAYLERGQGATPESSGRKSDHFVGDWYVEYQKIAKDDPEAPQRASDLLRRWEQGDPDVMALWKQMNEWTISGIDQTYEMTDIHFDAVYYESDTYKSGRQEILSGVDTGVFFRDGDGAVWVDLEDAGLDKKVLLRADGTSLYITQDIGTAIARHRDWEFDRLVYVVASEQRYHFQVLFEVLKRLGYSWASNLFHLSYGMVNLPTGRMKSREGTVVDADDLIAQLMQLAKTEIESKGRIEDSSDVDETSRRIALGALHYYLLMVNPNKDMVFDPAESISFTGNTGPYLQYVGARISSMIRKSSQTELVSDAELDYSVLKLDEEWELVRLLGEFPRIVAQAAAEYNPTLIAGHLYEVAKLYSRYYHDHRIITHEDKAVRSCRLALSKGVASLLRSGL